MEEGFIIVNKDQQIQKLNIQFLEIFQKNAKLVSNTFKTIESFFETVKKQLCSVNNLIYIVRDLTTSGKALLKKVPSEMILRRESKIKKWSRRVISLEKAPLSGGEAPALLSEFSADNIELSISTK
ncbi:hypothetical protein RclHR1_09990001 [Rhizophagus clarus]|uniref:Uncharacterized protein n=1 Tax=Rhizophagus clarus TaxID=94130 RepID=A0A2Z6S6H0_9GLOM|nr:hypothetical protein RclHR1_09990001 [Rhizophagus clarus]GES83388.1 hypothetical protein RCL_jg16086.t1 [Rhizophagus clarus]